MAKQHFPVICYQTLGDFLLGWKTWIKTKNVKQTAGIHRSALSKNSLKRQAKKPAFSLKADVLKFDKKFV